jgi:hypothetical protein
VKKLLIMTAIVLVAVFVVAPRFVRWTTNRPNVPVGTAALRLAVLQRTFIDSTTVADSADVVAVVMDWNMGGKTTGTLVVYTDGKTSLYVSPGKVLTSGNDERIREAAERFRAAVADHSDQFGTTADFDPPANGRVRFYIITRTGTFANRAEMIAVLQNQTQPLHPLLETGQMAAAEMQRSR